MGSSDFVVPVPAMQRRRCEPLDLYGAEPGEHRPGALVIHGGRGAPDADPPPREDPTFVAYAKLLAERGAVAATFNHRLHDADHAPLAADDLGRAVTALRAHNGVDPDRIGLWFFSMGGVLAASWLRDPPPWLRAIAWNYPILAPGPDWSGDIARFDCIDAIVHATVLPKLLLRVEHEIEGNLFGPAQDRLVTAAHTHRSHLDVLDVPGAHHPFEDRDHTHHTRAAVTSALDWMLAALTSPHPNSDGRSLS